MSKLSKKESKLSKQDMINARILLMDDPKGFFLIDDIPSIMPGTAKSAGEKMINWVDKAFIQEDIDALYCFYSDERYLYTMTQKTWAYYCGKDYKNQILFDRKLCSNNNKGDIFTSESFHNTHIPILYVFIGDLIKILKKYHIKPFVAVLNDLQSELKKDKKLDETLINLLGVSPRRDKQKIDREQRDIKITELFNKRKREFPHYTDVQIADQIAGRRGENSENVRKIYNENKRNIVEQEWEKHFFNGVYKRKVTQITQRIQDTIINNVNKEIESFFDQNQEGIKNVYNIIDYTADNEQQCKQEVSYDDQEISIVKQCANQIHLIATSCLSRIQRINYLQYPKVHIILQDTHGSIEELRTEFFGTRVSVEYECWDEHIKDKDLLNKYINQGEESIRKSEYDLFIKDVVKTTGFEYKKVEKLIYNIISSHLKQLVIKLLSNTLDENELNLISANIKIEVDENKICINLPKNIEVNQISKNFIKSSVLEMARLTSQQKCDFYLGDEIF